MIYITTQQQAEQLLNSITKAIKQSGAWEGTKTTKLCDLYEFKSGDFGILIVKGYESFYPDNVLKNAVPLPPEMTDTETDINPI